MFSLQIALFLRKNKQTNKRMGIMNTNSFGNVNNKIPNTMGYLFFLARFHVVITYGL
jgi:hypothetical protein